MRILVTGGAGFIGSNLVDALLQRPEVTSVRVLDNLATGAEENLSEALASGKVELMKGDIREFETCAAACADVDLISHQAALGSVPRSIDDPLTTNAVNSTGTLHLFEAARRAGIRRVVYAASSSTYGDHPALPKKEDQIGRPLSPYAVTKYVNELYANIYGSVYGLELTGLRYFNVFGPRQNPDGPYAAVIPLFIRAVLDNEPPLINGDGQQSRDFTFVANAVQANLLALFAPSTSGHQVYNIACGQQTSLTDLLTTIKELAGSDLAPRFGPDRPGEVKHSLADVSKAAAGLGYEPKVTLREGLKTTLDWYRKRHNFSFSI